MSRPPLSENIDRLINENFIDNLLAAALKETIKLHGDIDIQLIPSVVKRFAPQLKAELKFIKKDWNKRNNGKKTKTIR